MVFDVSTVPRAFENLLIFEDAYLVIRMLWKYRKYKKGIWEMAEKKNIMTYAGLKKLEDELQDLKVVRRQEVAEKIREAREQGDLSENAIFSLPTHDSGNQAFPTRELMICAPLNQCSY